MITAYIPTNGVLRSQTVAADAQIPPDAVWIDLVSPSGPEDKLVESLTGIDIPTREDMQEIEPSSRLYIEGGARYMTAAVLCGVEYEQSTLTTVSFILTGNRLVTVRYGDPRPFSSVAGRLARTCAPTVTGEMLLGELLDAIIDRAADVLEQVGADVERTSKRIFERSTENANSRYRAILSHIGRKEGIVSSARESLASLTRLVSFLGADGEGIALSKEMRANAKVMGRDLSSLSDYANFIGNKLQFLLDATIGMVSLEQNNIIKIFAVLSVVLMPPTLIASIYGMNFQHMPELATEYGYPLALVGMVISGILPYVFFKIKGWL